MNQFTTADCDFAIVCSVNGKTYQVSMSSDKIKEFINSTGEFKVFDDELQGIVLDNKKK